MNSGINIIPPDAPISFTASATDLAGVTLESAYRCYMINGAGKEVNKEDSCVVQTDGGTLSVLDSGGVGDNIVWTVTATDANDNVTTSSCTIFVHNPSGTDASATDPGEVKGNGNGKGKKLPSRSLGFAQE